MTDQSQITKLRHPCVGLSASVIKTFEEIACGLDSSFRPKVIRTLLDAGLIELVGERLLGRDAFGAIKVPVYEVPTPIHIQWCAWCAENVEDAESVR